MSLYRDEIEKIKFYRKRITGELLRAGIPPDSASVEEIASRIDSKLAVFQYKYEAAGADFNPEKFNMDFISLREDLLILYKVVCQVCIRDYEELEDFANSRLRELDTLVKKCRRLADFEAASAGLGRTVYIGTEGFNIRIENDTAEIDLGEISVREGTKLACFIEGDLINDDNVVFRLNGENCSPYRFNMNCFVVPGRLPVNHYAYELSKDHISYGVRRMNPEGVTFTGNSSYMIYAGKNMVKTGNLYREKLGNAGITIEEPGTVSFWLRDATFMDAVFSEDPEECSFENGSMINLKKDSTEKVSIKHGSNFSVDFLTDGAIYAERKAGYLSGGNLYYAGNDELSDFLIEETQEGKETVIGAKVCITGINPADELKIDYIAVKELASGDDPV